MSSLSPTPASTIGSTRGFHDVSIIHRWQGLPRIAAGRGAPTANGLLTKIGDLDRVLPEGMKRVTPADRAVRLSERLATFNTRFVVGRVGGKAERDKGDNA